MKGHSAKKCIIWGAGYFGVYIQQAVLDYGYEILAYCDSNKSGKIDGYSILTIENTIKLCQKDSDIDIIIGVKNKTYVEEIQNVIRERFPMGSHYMNGMDVYSAVQENQLNNHYQNMKFKWKVDLKTEFLIWLDNIQSEVEYWVTSVADKRGVSHSYNEKCRAATSFEYSKLVNKVIEGSTILDVGCGLISPYGDELPSGKKINLVPVDALAHYYNEINKHIKDGKRSDYSCKFGMFEFIANGFGKDYADAIIINNALDHCIDPFRSIVECVYALKVGGELHMAHRRAEAVYEKWMGLHRWNVDSIDGKFVLWNRENAININEVLADYATVEVTYNDAKNREEQTVSVVITKKKDFKLEQLLDTEKDVDVLVSCVDALMKQQSKYNTEFEQLLKSAQF